MIMFRDLAQAIGQTVHDLQNQDKSQGRRTEERTLGKDENVLKRRRDYHRKAQAFPSKNEMEAYRTAIKQRDKERLQ